MCRFRKIVEGEEELPWELVGHGAIATNNITECKEFWRTFVRNPVVMNWIEEEVDKRPFGVRTP